DESSFIGEPFYQHGHWNDVPKTKTNSADQAVTEIQPPHAMREAGEKNSQPIKRATSQCNDAGSLAVQPQPAKERSTAQHENTNRKRERYFRDTPPELLCERDSENAPSIDGT